MSWDGSPRLWLTRPQQHPGSQGCGYRPQPLSLRDDKVLLEHSLWTGRALWVEGPVGAIKAELPGGAKCGPGLAPGYARCPSGGTTSPRHYTRVLHGASKPSVATTASVWFPCIPADYERVRAWQLAHAQDTVSPPSSVGPCNAEGWGKMFTVVSQSINSSGSCKMGSVLTSGQVMLRV